MPAWCRRRLATLSRRREKPARRRVQRSRTDCHPHRCHGVRLPASSRRVTTVAPGLRSVFDLRSLLGDHVRRVRRRTRNRHRAGPGAATRTSIQAPDGQVTSHDRPPVVDREVRQRTEISEGSVVVDDVEPSVGGARFLSAPVESAITPLALGPIVAAVSVGRRRLARTAPS